MPPPSFDGRCPLPAPTPDLVGIAGLLRAAGCLFAAEETGVLMSVQQSPDQLSAMIERRLNEPHASADGGDDGLDLQRRIIATASHWLSPSGCLLVETGQRKAHRRPRSSPGTVCSPASCGARSWMRWWSWARFSGNLPAKDRNFRE